MCFTKKFVANKICRNKREHLVSSVLINFGCNVLTDIFAPIFRIGVPHVYSSQQNTMQVINLKIVLFYVRSLEYETNAVCFCFVLVSYIQTRAHACIIFICVYDLSEDICTYVGHTQPTLTAINEDHYSSSSVAFNNTLTDTQNTLQTLASLLTMCRVRGSHSDDCEEFYRFSPLKACLLPDSCLFLAWPVLQP